MSNDSIYGIGESNTTYSSRLKLVKPKLKAFLHFKHHWSRITHFVDQINHNQKTPNVELLNNNKTRLIFLVREPADSIQSIINLTKNHYSAWPINKVIHYYNARLEYLLKLLEEIPKHRRIIINSDSIVDDTDKTLQNLTTFLSLDYPLTSTYKTHTFTGRHGDPSGNISSGKVFRTTRHSKIEADISSSNTLYKEVLSKIT